MQTYTVEQTAKILQVRKNFVYDLIFTGRLRAVRLSERRFRISEAALAEFLRQEEARVAETCAH
ncbi:helix-turn-helix domain-containing protein [Syntrophomonas palmitatica]|uniref:helix-turn-helix domain-containing protein n=1 Tax=Syntrophomonas palmitatica TaxID=402877 RepID=UPI000A7D7F8D|nr:helix-turn-helix domain-containing protein [Syntrophomonas palmitatica]